MNSLDKKPLVIEQGLIVQLDKTIGELFEDLNQEVLDIKEVLDTKVGLSGDQTIKGVKTFSSFPVTPSDVPTGTYQVVNKQYVDNKAADGIPVGTKMLFQQTNAPTGWVKDTTHNNKALRVVTGTVSSGGTSDFTTAFNSSGIATSRDGEHSHAVTVNNHTLTVAQMPSHNHAGGARKAGSHDGGRNYPYTSLTNTSSAGGSGSHNHGASSNSTGAHTHTLNLNVQYVDLIIATKQ